MRSDTSTPTTRPAPAAPGRLASRQPGSAPDVDYLVTGADPVGGAKVLVVSAQLSVVEVQAVRRGHGRDAMNSSALAIKIALRRLHPLRANSTLALSTIYTRRGELWSQRLRMSGVA